MPLMIATGTGASFCSRLYVYASRRWRMALLLHPIQRAAHVDARRVRDDVHQPLLARRVEHGLLRFDDGLVFAERVGDLGEQLLGGFGLVLPIAVAGRPEVVAAVPGLRC